MFHKIVLFTLVDWCLSEHVLTDIAEVKLSVFDIVVFTGSSLLSYLLNTI